MARPSAFIHCCVLDDDSDSVAAADIRICVCASGAPAHVQARGSCTVVAARQVLGSIMLAAHSPGVLKLISAAAAGAHMHGGKGAAPKTISEHQQLLRRHAACMQCHVQRVPHACAHST
jgi:hypothetical protein